ncbi:MAG: HD-GYP domain-containing protein [Lachnospiraceae bacterium]|nr:HD-GYP domain-containing protein [Lachnospiraceae bacterium]
MDKLSSEKKLRILEDALKAGVLLILAVSIILMGIALVDRNTEGEAPMGSFEETTFVDNWTLLVNGLTVRVRLPISVNVKEGKDLTIINTLPEDIHDGMSLMMRASMEDIRIYINDELRVDYSSASLKNRMYYLPSAWVVTELGEKDAGAKIRIDLTVKSKGIVNVVSISNGNNVWYKVIKDGMAVNLIAVLVFLLAVLILILTFLLGKRHKVGALRSLGFLMLNVTMWLFSESVLRQLIFARPSLSFYFSYFTNEVIGIFACIFFDDVQHREYHKRYLIVETLTFIQVIINMILNATGVIEFHNTLFLSHFWTIMCIVVPASCVITDILKKRVARYRVTAIGMGVFLFFSLGELVKYYVSKYILFGSFMCVGLLALMIATIIQTVRDEAEEYRIRERRQEAMTFSTIETIASSIDAKDEYTGNHSERVGFYAVRLARRMADEYGLGEEDILRIHYIGLVHDIGKIGVADSVLNKAGKLTDEEFSLMKKHPVIGYEIMSSMGDIVPGLLEGIRSHHERYDGTGYPDGLAGDKIPLIARILTIADSFDAMTSNRVYRPRLTDEEVRNEMVRCSGTQFDPKLTKMFLELLDKGELTAATVDGLALNENGEIRTSAILEHRLQQDIKDGVKINHASHVRMLCYIIKLMENKGKDYRIFFVDTEDETAKKKLREALKRDIGHDDISILYTRTTWAVALFDRTDRQMDEFIRKLTGECNGVAVYKITHVNRF